MQLKHSSDVTVDEVKNDLAAEKGGLAGLRSFQFCACGVVFDVDHAMVCRRGGFIIQRHNELRDLEAELLKMVCNDVQIEPVLQEINGGVLKPSANRAVDAWLDIHARSFWERQESAFFDVGVSHPNVCRVL